MADQQPKNSEQRTMTDQLDGNLIKSMYQIQNARLRIYDQGQQINKKDNQILELQRTLRQNSDTHRKDIQKMSNDVLKLKLELEAAKQAEKNTKLKVPAKYPEKDPSHLDEMLQNERIRLSAEFQSEKAGMIRRCDSAETVLRSIGYEETSTGHWVRKVRGRAKRPRVV